MDFSAQPKGENNLITLKEDYAAKKLFENKTVLKQFISDVLSIPMERIVSVKTVNPFLKRLRKKKQGILDVKAELNDDTKINIEIQICPQTFWERRQLFYLCRMYDEDLDEGDGYSKVKKCISIAILDFDLSKREKYHSIYRLRDEYGNIFSEHLELHTIELRKKLKGEDPLDDWVRLFNAETMEDLDNMTIVSRGIWEAIRIIKRMNIVQMLKEEHEQEIKARRDRYAQDDYVQKLGMAEGETKKLVALVVSKLKKGKTVEEISELLEEDIDLIERISHLALQNIPNYDIDYIVEDLMWEKKNFLHALENIE